MTLLTTPGRIARVPAVWVTSDPVFRRDRKEALVEVDPIDVQRHLAGLDYPAKKDELIATAEQNGAAQE